MRILFLPRRARVWACGVLAAALVPTAAPEAQASVHQRTFPATHVKRGVATFSLRRLDARSVLGGKLSWRGESWPLARRQLRAAARRGALRVRLTARARAAAAPRRPRLIVTTRVARPDEAPTLPVSREGPAAAPAPAPTAPAHYSVRGMYGRDASPSGFDTLVSLGFNAIDSNPYADSVDPVAAAGARGLVWLGGYSNETCTFNYSDVWVRSHIANVAGSSSVAGYFIDDEPNAAKCPTAPAQMRARSALVKSIDPGPPTFLVDYKVEQFKLWAGTVDLLGLDHYPCSIAHGCDYAKIDAQAAEADRLGVRYWGVVQAAGDNWYKVPTPAELHEQFRHWRATKMEGYLVFAWSWPSSDASLWLANNLDLQRQLAIENAA